MTSLKIADHIINEKLDDLSVLKKPVFDINMRLFKTSEPYRRLILGATEYLLWHLKNNYTDHSSIRGVSAAELALPWNIIAYKDQSQVARICLNPKITKASEGMTKTSTNCPSSPGFVEVMRHDNIDLEFYDLNGHKVEYRTLGRSSSGWCIQHEIQHNQGICPKDIEIKKEEIKETPKLISGPPVSPASVSDLLNAEFNKKKELTPDELADTCRRQNASPVNYGYTVDNKTNFTSAQVAGYKMLAETANEAGHKIILYEHPTRPDMLITWTVLTGRKLAIAEEPRASFVNVLVAAHWPANKMNRRKRAACDKADSEMRVRLREEEEKTLGLTPKDCKE